MAIFRTVALYPTDITIQLLSQLISIAEGAVSAVVIGGKWWNLPYSMPLLKLATASINT